MTDDTLERARIAAVGAARTASHVVEESLDLLGGSGSHGRVVREISRLERRLETDRADVAAIRKRLRKLKGKEAVVLDAASAATAHEAAINYADRVLAVALKRPLWGDVDRAFTWERYDERIEAAARELRKHAVSPDELSALVETVREESERLEAG